MKSAVGALKFTRERLKDARQAPASGYRTGYLAACQDVIDYILTEMWEDGEDDPDEQ